MLAHTMREALCNIIGEAFAGVKLGSGIGLQEAQGLDDCEDDATRARYRASDEKENWAHISVSELNRCYSSLSYGQKTHAASR